MEHNKKKFSYKARPEKAGWKKPSREDRPATPREESEIGNGAVIGRNAVRELLRSGRAVDKLLVQSGPREGALVPLVGEAIERGIPVVETERRKLDSLAGGAPHQGIIALAAEKEYCTVEDILAIAAERGEQPLIVVADGISDAPCRRPYPRGEQGVCGRDRASGRGQGAEYCHRCGKSQEGGRLDLRRRGGRR